MEIKGLKEELKKNMGASVNIDISHKLYGNQKVRCNLDYIFDKERIGFRLNKEQEVFIYLKDLVGYGVEDGIYFADSVMKISIKLNRAA